MRFYPYLQHLGQTLKGRLPGRSRRPKRSPPRPTSFRPEIEVLEERRLLSTLFVVDKPDDDGSPNTLRWAITQANLDPDPTSQINIGFTFTAIPTIHLSGALDPITHPHVHLGGN